MSRMITPPPGGHVPHEWHLLGSRPTLTRRRRLPGFGSPPSGGRTAAHQSDWDASRRGSGRG